MNRKLDIVHDFKQTKLENNPIHLRVIALSSSSEN